MPLDVEVIDPSSAQADDYEPAVWRVMVDPPGEGAWNMAVDEALLEAVGSGESPPTLRFFAWEPPCLSLGQGQSVSDVDVARLEARGWSLVRRITGGRAILHTDELTYSVVIPAADRRVAGGVIESYRRLSRGLLAGLERLGADLASHAGPLGAARAAQGPVCFEVPSDYEITVSGRKLLGSAQTRRRGVVLQHGTLPLEGDLGRICDGLAFESQAAREEAKARVRARAATLAEALGRRVSFAQAAEAMRHGFAAALNLEFAEGELSATEQARALSLRDEKYAAETWMFSR